MLRKILVVLAVVFFGLSVWAEVSGYHDAAVGIMMGSLSFVFFAVLSKMFSWLWR